MDIRKYSQEVVDFLNNLADEEFEKLLKEYGIDKCPVVTDDDILSKI